MITLVVTQLLEKALNKIITLNPDNVEKLTVLSGKVLKIEVLELPQAFYLFVNPQSISIHTVFDGEADATVQATLRMLLQQMSNKTPVKEILISGDVEWLQQLQYFFNNLNIDWEEYLAFLLGDITSHQLGNIWQRVKSASTNFGSRFIEDTAEYIQEEKKLSPSIEEVEDFYEDIFTLRHDIERLEARINCLKEKLQHENT